MDAEEVINLLGLEPHPEGGFYRETYRCRELLPESALPSRYSGDRSFGTAIYYMLTPETFSAMHRIKSDEIFHFYMGDPVTMLQFHPKGESEVIALGQDIRVGERLQVVVPAYTWQGMFLNEGGVFALLGTTVTPGFDFEDFELAGREALAEEFPQRADLIKRLTRI